MSDEALPLKASFGRVEPVAEKVARSFYARLLLEDAQLRDLVPVVMNAQRSRLLGAPVRVVQGFDSPVQLDEFLRQLGQDHRKFGVRPEHYAAVGRPLVATLREYSPDSWTPEIETALVTAYGAIAERMVAGAGAGAGAVAGAPPW